LELLIQQLRNLQKPTSGEDSCEQFIKSVDEFLQKSTNKQLGETCLETETEVRQLQVLIKGQSTSLVDRNNDRMASLSMLSKSFNEYMQILDKLKGTGVF